MATGPLGLLGETIANAGRDYANIKLRNDEREQTRQERLDDRAQEREYQLEDRATSRQNQLTDIADQRKYEDAKFYERQQAAMIMQLEQDGVLDPKDAGNPDAVAAALKTRGPEYTRNVQELAGYKASLPNMLQHVNVEGASNILNMGPGDIEAARQIMSKVITAVGNKTQTEEDRKTNSATNAAAVFAATNAARVNVMSKIDSIDAFTQSVSDGTYQPTPEEQKAARDQVLARRPELGKFSPANKAALDAAVHASLWGDGQNPGSIQSKAYLLNKKRTGLESQYKDISYSMNSIDDLKKSGVFDIGKPEDFTKLTVPVDNLAPQKATPGTPISPQGFLDTLKKNTPPAAAPAGLLDTVGDAAMNTLALPGKAIDAATRYGGAAVRGLGTGDFTPDSKGLVTKAGEGLADFAWNVAGGNDTSDDQASIDKELLDLNDKTDPASINRKAYLQRLKNSYATPTSLGLGP